MSLFENVNLAMNLVACGDDKATVANDLVGFVNNNYIEKHGLNNLTIEAACYLSNTCGIEFGVNDGSLQEITS
ncbi:MAG: hypothetical protein IJX07_06175 [Bacillales bacterium]|nr:hypothetical protein [Bacillales bacterium]